MKYMTVLLAGWWRQDYRERSLPGSALMFQDKPAREQAVSGGTRLTR
jgi:hypothetical protein